MARVLCFGAVWIALVVGLAVSMAPPLRITPREPTAIAIPPPAPMPRVGERYPGWTVTKAYSAHQMMVVEVESDAPLSATSIAAQVVEPLQDRYDEVLIYVRAPGQPAEDLAARRVQWTKRAGYRESVYAR